MIKQQIYFGVLLCLFLFYGGCARQSDESPLADPTELTIAQIHAAYKNGSLTAGQLVQIYLERIEQRNGSLNAITVLNPQALQTARELDAEFRSTGKLRPLHGIPVIVKDNYHTIGLQTAAGSFALRNFKPDYDAWQVCRMKEAGAIVLAKSNMAEWAFSAMHTNSSTFGTTRNPYNLDHVPAGSSGGTAAAVASNMGAIGLGSDTGNSIRGPSSHNALVGFRSTLGLTSRAGIVPLYSRNDVGGPMCRTVEDAARVLEVIAGYDPADPITRHSKGKVPANYRQFLEADGLKGTRIGVLRQLSDDDVHPEIAALFEQAIKDMRAAGAEIIDPLTVPAFAELREDQWCDEFAKDIDTYLQTEVKCDTLQTMADIIRVGHATPYGAEVLDYFTTHSGRETNSQLPCGDPYDDPRRIAFREAIENEMDRQKVDVLIYPSWNHPPAKIDDWRAGYKGDNSQIIAPHTGQPAFNVPMGYTSGNLPAGLQVLGRMFDEPTLIKICYAYEQATRHRKPPADISSSK